MSQRIWLSAWEWACCGEPFAVGDEVTLTVSRGETEWLTTMIGAETAAQIDAVESHHDETGETRVTAVVQSVSAVSAPHRVRRLRRVSPTGTDARTDPGRWPDRGDRIAFGTRSAYLTSIEQIPGTVTLHPVTHVPTGSSGRGIESGRTPDGPGHDVVEDRLIGYIVRVGMATEQSSVVGRPPRTS